MCRALFSILTRKGTCTEEQIRKEGCRQRGLYDPAFEHDACGIGAVVDIKGRRGHQTVDDALKIVGKLEHRAGKDAEGRTGDGGSPFAPESNIIIGNVALYGATSGRASTLLSCRPSLPSMWPPLARHGAGRF